MKKIVTSTGEVIEYKPIPLFLGVQRIDKAIAKENLQIAKKILEDNDIRYSLLAGTLLGAMREHDFIDHDEDIDLFVFSEQRQALIDLLPIFISNGFIIARYHRTKKLLSIIRKGQYIDFNFFDVYNNDIRNSGGWLVLSRFFENIANYDFLGTEYPMPIDSEGYLECAYGKNWRTPIKWNNYEMTWYKKKLFILKEFVKSIIPFSLYMFFSKRRDKPEMEKHFRYFARYSHDNNLPMVDLNKTKI